MSYDPTDCEMGICGPCDSCRKDLALDESDLSDETQARPEDVGPMAPVPSFPVELHPDFYRLVPVEKPDAYVISDEDGLRRAFSAIRHARRRLRQNIRMQAPEVEALEAELAALKEANARANAAQLRAIESYENAVQVYAQTHRKEVLGSETPREGEKKTRDYGIGRISYRSGGGEYRWRQDMTPKEREAALLGWAKEMTAYCDGKTDVPLLEQVERPVLANIKRWARAAPPIDGAPLTPGGLEWVPEHEDVVIKVGEEK